jgi:hypothetical protein
VAPGKKKTNNTDKNNSAANVIKNKLKKKKPNSTNGGPQSKIPRRSDSPPSEMTVIKIVAPKLPQQKIRKKVVQAEPEKVVTKQPNEFKEDDAPDIIDHEAEEQETEKNKNKPRKKVLIIGF